MFINHSEEIRKDIKKLEQEIDNKLFTYSNFSEKIEQLTTEEENIISFEEGKDISPLAYLEELEILIKKLVELNKKLNESNTTISIIDHHRSKLDDFLKEYKILKNNINQAWKRVQLFKGRKLLDTSPEKNINIDNLIRERNSIHNSNIMVNDLLSQAQFTKDQLNEQTRTLMGTGLKVKGVGRQLPDLQSLMNKIKNKKNRNTVILSFVIASCIFFLLWYWWSS
jgi:Golgi SNAP receptor complex protein 1